MPSNNKFIYAINECSLKIYDGIITKKIKVEDIYEIVKNKTLNINIDYEISDNKLKKMYNVLNKEEIFDEILFNKLIDDITNLIYKDKINKKDIIKVSTIYQNILKLFWYNKIDDTYNIKNYNIKHDDMIEDLDLLIKKLYNKEI